MDTLDLGTGDEAARAMVHAMRDNCSAEHDWYRLPDYRGYRAGCTCGEWESQSCATFGEMCAAVTAHLDMTPEQRRRAAEYVEGYKAGKSDAQGGYSRNWSGYSGQRKAGYRSGYRWGQTHPLPAGIHGPDAHSAHITCAQCPPLQAEDVQS